jgi:hypothetical protein
MSNHKRGRARLRIAPPGEIPDDRAAVAQALLRRYARSCRPFPTGCWRSSASRS